MTNKNIKILRDIDKLPAEAIGCTVVIGNFDGLHHGHRMLIELARKKAREMETKLLILTFAPHPRRYFMPDAAPFMLTPGAQHEKLLSGTGADFALYLKFDQELAHLSAEEFIQVILKDKLNARHIIVGDDFCFGKGRKGHTQTIKESGIPLTALSKMQDHNERSFSSSRIRDAVSGGDMRKAGQLMGRPFEIIGEVIHGDKRGRELGYPTANIRLGEYIHPAYGVYACKVKIPGDDQWRAAATNIGIRPMFESPEALIEAHLLDFDGDLYGKKLRLRPLRKVRNEMKFESLDELIEQMGNDCNKIKEIVKNWDKNA